MKYDHFKTLVLNFDMRAGDSPDGPLLVHNINIQLLVIMDPVAVISNPLRQHLKALTLIRINYAPHRIL